MLALFLNHEAHIVHDFIDAESRLFDLVYYFVFLQHDLALQLIIYLHVLIGQQRLFMVLIVTRPSGTLVQMTVIHLTAQHVVIAVLLLVGPRHGPRCKGP